MAVADKENAPALPAASIILVRDGNTGMEVLMMERAKTMRFAPGAFVFPGGKVDDEDRNYEQWVNFSTSDIHKNDLHFRVAALRELYEETSVLLLKNKVSQVKKAQHFLGYVQSCGDLLDTNSLVPFAHWVTPETMPRRFDTHFYLAAHNGQAAEHDGDEAVSLRWVAPEKLLQDWHEDKVPLMFPTRLNLMKLARAQTVDQALKQAREAKIVRTMPTVTRDKGSVSVSIDEASGYGVTHATEKELSVERPK